MGTKDVSLQDAIAGFRTIDPMATAYYASSAATSAANSTSQTDNRGNNMVPDWKNSLVYGRMYFPGSALEAMIIKRISNTTQLLLKCISNPNLEKNGSMIVYLQKNTPTFLREFIYSTNESLFGFRCLYNFGMNEGTPAIDHTQFTKKFDNSVMSLGTEIWYAARTMLPGLSTAFRYSTTSTSTGKPLTMTLACNPILGHISSTYTVKTSVSSSFCSKYDFNIFSYASNLSLGFELYNYSQPLKLSEHGDDDDVTQAPIPEKPSRNRIINVIQDSDDYFRINPNLLPSSNANVTRAFQNLVNESNFSSVVKCSTSLSDRVLKVLWEGRVKDFLVSAGVKVGINQSTGNPELNRFGISFSYAA
jgi:distribution and morphology protein 10